jgi:multiple sugar transport system substrate-binding protein
MATTDLRILVAGNPALEETIKRQWEFHTTEKLNVRTVETAKLATAKRLSSDVIVIPSHALGGLIEANLIAPIPVNSLSTRDGFPYPDVLPSVRRGQASWGRSIYAAPLGQPSWVLGIRPQDFTAMGVSPPATWNDLRQLIEQPPSPPEGKTPADWKVLAEPSGDGVSGLMTLRRAASFGASESQSSWIFNFEDLAPRLSEEHFVEALTQHVLCARYSGDKPLSPRDAWEAICSGAVSIAPAVVGQSSAKPPAEVEVRPLPGSRKIYSIADKSWNDRDASDAGQTALVGFEGFVACVTRESRHPKASFYFLDWLGKPEIVAAAIAPNEQTGLFLSQHLEDPKPWLPEGTDSTWATQFGKTLDAGMRWSPCLRLPGATEYLAVLDDAAKKCIADPSLSPATALAEAAKAWNEITDRLGRESQLRAYRHGVGSEA